MTYKIFTPNDDRTSLRIYPKLAAEIGLNESIVLLQLDYLINISKTKIIKGRKWTYQSTRKLHTDSFPFWSVSTIDRALKKASEKKLIYIGSFNKHAYDKTRWFAINWEAVCKLKTLVVIDGEVMGVSQNDTGSNQNDTGSNQNDTTIPETTPYITTDIKDLTAHAVEPKPSNNKKVPKYPNFKPFIGELSRITQMDLRIKSNSARLGKATKELLDAGYKIQDLKKFESWWYKNDWRGKQAQPPNPANVISDIGKLNGGKPVQTEEEIQAERLAIANRELGIV